MSFAKISDTAPEAPAGDAQALPDQTSNAFVSVLNLVIPTTAYAVGLSAVLPLGGTNPFVPSILKYPSPVWAICVIAFGSTFVNYVACNF